MSVNKQNDDARESKLLRFYLEITITTTIRCCDAVTCAMATCDTVMNYGAVCLIPN